ncbi:THUMP domain-containing class I SAM-dependent RNA methyltransferase [Alloyangia pacifica]|uniref:THUMP domain-containing class I SAM-dependent RNA methyltransferase n=1 Tax=Alloyangia pacifica TaxID=311180 RepID=UPI001CD54AEF|nr:class I SAM-dependent RNA methyltransferase [Alloyangia pacifica]MCA0995861.1 class I SAM-dependent RNA methyltransferase [Alloyangia pacifica]
MENTFEIFLACAPGLEPVLVQEAKALGFGPLKPEQGGVSFQGSWPEVARANLELRGAARVLARIGGFPALHLAQLDKRARKFPWGDILRADVPVKVEALSRKSKIYHAGAAKQRIERAINEELGAPIAEDGVRILARIENNLVSFSVDTSGQPLHRRGLKQAVSKAPMRETLASLFMRACGYDGVEPVLDPMCGSGTFPIEGAEIAAGLLPGRARAFDFERLAVFAPADLKGMKRQGPLRTPSALYYGSDRDAGAIRSATANAERAGVTEWTRFDCRPVSELERPEGPPGLVMVNPPYGARIGEKGPLHALHASLGTVLKEKFGGWRVGIITTEPGLAKATGLRFLPTGAPVAHGSLKVKLYRTEPL